MEEYNFTEDGRNFLVDGLIPTYSQFINNQNMVSIKVSWLGEQIILIYAHTKVVQYYTFHSSLIILILLLRYPLCILKKGGNTLFIFASKKGDPSVTREMQLLLHMGANIDIRNKVSNSEINRICNRHNL